MKPTIKALRCLPLALLISCGGGSNSSPSTCAGDCNNGDFLSITDVKTVLAQAAQEAQAHNSAATIAVTDRVGNVLAVYRMNIAAAHSVTLSTNTEADGNASGNRGVIDSGLEGIVLPTLAAPLKIDDLAAISKALTGAYLSTEGNAFSTRTANQIVQEHFNPGELFQPAGPLFGVQFSQLACSDFMRQFTGSADPGPKRSPLGLSADPGGFPLYKNGTVVGGVGVMADGFYGLDANITDDDRNLDELIALAATFGFEAPIDRRADHITVDGKTLRYSDVSTDQLLADPAQAINFDALDAINNSLVATPGYSLANIIAGTVFGQNNSGVRPATAASFTGLDSFVLVDENNIERFPVINGSDGVNALQANEVETLLVKALEIANRSRAQIRRPLNTPARVTISIVDTDGNILGVIRSKDAPIFGADVSVQKARTAAFFSSADAAATIAQLPDAHYLLIDDTQVAIKASVNLNNYVTALRAFLNAPTALADGAVAFSDRAGGNLSRPTFPDGIDGANPGPLSKAAGSWSPFSTGLQLDLVINGILQHVLATAGAGVPDVSAGCGGIAIAADLTPTVSALTTKKLANGIQIFPGSVPIYRGNQLVGGIGVSGDGVDQDDMIAMLGLYEAELALGGAINRPPMAMRADQLTPQGVRLRFVQCPQAPFLDSAEQTPCEGK
ncbi:heme-binding protein [Simiduia curdlanivorans]|uniref:Heme-binding protein n=1 Tax=Simiduia curdlanivorans TaxID=1492769 RepID=A0ABV8UZC4_9GAMM|nr:heme-binding protein [Simiduia curdlanivorans]MDN3640305.1 heme-binding protein [Simiduia curdlanivorans]